MAKAPGGGAHSAAARVIVREQAAKRAYPRRGLRCLAA